MVDVFGLLDKDNDETLFSFSDKLSEFWGIISYEIDKIDDNQLRDQAKKWRR